MSFRQRIPTKAALEKQRGAELAKIHIAKNKLGLDDETYRAVLHKLTSKQSSKELNTIERGKVLDYFKANGWKGKKTRVGRPHNVDSPVNRAKQLKKIEALLADANREWAYLLTKNNNSAQSLLERLTGKQRLEFCDGEDLRKVIATLAIDEKRRKKREATHG